MPDSSASAAGLPCWAAYATRPSPTSSSMSACRRRAGFAPGRPGCWPHQVPSISLTISSASSGLRTASNSRAARSISAKSAFGGGAGSPAMPDRGPGGPEWPELPAPSDGGLRRLCGLTRTAFQIQDARCHAWPRRAARFCPSAADSGGPSGLPPGLGGRHGLGGWLGPGGGLGLCARQGLARMGLCLGLARAGLGLARAEPGLVQAGPGRA